MKWQDYIKTEKDYKALKESGMMFEFHPNIPLSWEECLKELQREEGEKEYVKSYN